MEIRELTRDGVTVFGQMIQAMLDAGRLGVAGSSGSLTSLLAGFMQRRHAGVRVFLRRLNADDFYVVLSVADGTANGFTSFILRDADGSGAKRISVLYAEDSKPFDPVDEGPSLVGLIKAEFSEVVKK